MSTTKKQKAVILLEKTSLDFYASLTGSVYKLAFTPGAVNNFEIIDINSFSTQIKSFLETNKIVPSSIILVLAESTLFSKTYHNAALAALPSKDILHQEPPLQTPQLAPSGAKVDEQLKATATQIAQAESDQQIDMQKFIEYVPFEAVLSKMYKVDTGTVVAATNSEFVHALKKIFEDLGSQIDLVIPVFILTSEIQMANGLSAEAARLLIEKQLSYKQQNMLVVQILTIPGDGGRTEIIAKSKKNLRVLLMTGAFAVLIVVLIIMFLNMMNENAALEKKRQQPKTIKKSVVTVIPTQPTIVATTSAEVSRKDITIQITNASGSIGKDTQLQAALKSAGYTRVTLGSPQTSLSNTTTVILSSGLSDFDQDAIKSKISEQFPTAIFRQNTDTQFEVFISIGKV